MTPADRNAAIRRALEGSPVSRREVARRADISHTTLNRIVSGEQRATAETSRAIAAALREIAGELADGADRIDAEGGDDE